MCGEEHASDDSSGAKGIRTAKKRKPVTIRDKTQAKNTYQKKHITRIGYSLVEKNSSQPVFTNQSASWEKDFD